MATRSLVVGLRWIGVVALCATVALGCDSSSDGDGNGSADGGGSGTTDGGGDGGSTGGGGRTDGTGGTTDGTGGTTDGTGGGASDATGSVSDANRGGGGTADAGPSGDTSGDPDAGGHGTTDEPHECPDPNGLRPSRRSEHAGIYDPVGQRVVVFGGTVAVGENCGFPISTFETETWLYDTRCDHWEVVDGGPPTGLTRHQAVYDSTEHRMLVFGGRHRVGSSGNYTLHDAVWAFDLATEQWQEIFTSSGPTARINAGVAYDPSGHRLLVFGGNSSASGFGYSPLQDLWVLDLDTKAWKLVPTVDTPSPRLFQSALWDDARHQLVIHGGADSTAFNQNAKYFDKLWAIDPDEKVPTWEQLDAGSDVRPDGRFWGTLALDEERDRYVLFGGHDDGAQGNRNDLWAWFPEAGQWSVIRLGDTWNKPANGFCDFPPDFTNVDYDAPERRNAHVFVVGPHDHAWLTGGKTDCGAIDDMVDLDLEAHVWTNAQTSTVGESCLRRGGLTCNDLCF